MEHWTQLEIDSLQRAEGVLDPAETLVGAHRGGGITLCGRQVGADHEDAVERGLGGDAEGVLGVGGPAGQVGEGSVLGRRTNFRLG